MVEEAGVKVGAPREAMDGGVVVVDGVITPPLRGTTSFFDVGSTTVTGGADMMVVVGILVLLESRLIIPQAFRDDF
jgi:hypothetical protein